MNTEYIYPTLCNMENASIISKLKQALIDKGISYHQQSINYKNAKGSWERSYRFYIPDTKYRDASNRFLVLDVMHDITPYRVDHYRRVNSYNWQDSALTALSWQH